jgi:hypothetical protein
MLLISNTVKIRGTSYCSDYYKSIINKRNEIDKIVLNYYY